MHWLQENFSVLEFCFSQNLPLLPRYSQAIEVIAKQLGIDNNDLTETPPENSLATFVQNLLRTFAKAQLSEDVESCFFPQEQILFVTLKESLAKQRRSLANILLEFELIDSAERDVLFSDPLAMAPPAGCSQEIPSLTSEMWGHDFIRASILTGEYCLEDPIAVIDSGLSFGHPAMAGSFIDPHTVAMRGNVFDGCNPLLNPCDSQSHGTAIASLIGGRAIPKGASHRIGLCEKARLLIVKFTEVRFSTTEYLAKALLLANGSIPVCHPECPDVPTSPMASLFVLAATYKHGKDHPAVQRAVTAIHDAKGVIVTAAGDEETTTEIQHLGSMPGVISVGSLSRYLDERGQQQVCIQGGTNCSPFLSILAPGGDVLLANGDCQGAVGSFPYFRSGGTSFAAPYFAGALAALWWHPDITQARAKRDPEERASDLVQLMSRKVCADLLWRSGPKPDDLPSDFRVIDLSQLTASATSCGGLSSMGTEPNC